MEAFIKQQSFYDVLGADDFEEFDVKKSTDWKWTFADYPDKNGLTVFSCFACGGGSTMGYKLAGYDVIGCNEIDRRMNEIYVANHNPKYNFLMDIRQFNRLTDDQLPPELFSLDILDGSPPCTTFSMAGQREETWGKSKKFREGQQEQTLDDLLFVFIETVGKFRPKFAIMENVEGLIRGSAWKYVQRVYTEFKRIGYQVKHWLLKGNQMGIPQKRHRVFFIATRLDLDLRNLNLHFNYEEIPFGQIKSPRGSKKIGGETLTGLINEAKFGERSLEPASYRLSGKYSFFNYYFLYDHAVANTLTTGGNFIRWDTKEQPSKDDIVSISTFPQDFNFLSDSLGTVNYVCGMSVPPLMIKRIAERLTPILLGGYDGKK